MEKRTIRYGVVGSSPITDTLIAGAKQHPHLCLTAVYSRTKQRGEAYALQHGAKYVFDSLEEMAQSDCIDMVYIASPNICHMEQAKVFLKNGKHVLCEKPLTAYPEELREAFDIAEKNNVLLTEAIMLLFQPQLQLLKDAVAQIGNIHCARFDFSQFSSKYPAYMRGETPNIFNPALEAGTLQDLGVYCVYPALILFGKPLSLQTNATFMSTKADGAGVSVWNYADKQVVLTYNKLGQAMAPSEIIGDKGSVTIASISKLENMILHLHNTPPQTIWGEEEKSVLMGREIATFADWIVAGKNPAYDMHKELSLDVCVYMHAMRQQANVIFSREAVTSFG